MGTFKTWKKFGKPGKNFDKTSGNRITLLLTLLFLFIKPFVFVVLKCFFLNIFTTKKIITDKFFLMDLKNF